MSRRQSFKLAGVGAVACAACCAGPILGLLATAGLATVAGFVMFGTIALVVGAVSISLILHARSRKRSTVEAGVQMSMAISKSPLVAYENPDLGGGSESAV